MTHSSSLRYGTAAQFFHWATALLVMTAFIYGLGGSEHSVYAASRDAERQLHETLGMAVFALAALRLTWRWFAHRPIPREQPGWERVASQAAHAVLYFLLFALPMTAIAGAWLEGHPIMLLANIALPSPVPASHALGATIATIHTWLGDAIVWLAGLHALAALGHHFLFKDRVLASMLPRWIYRG
jgi:cytochrome b561